MDLLATFRLLIPEFSHLADDQVEQWLSLIEAEVTADFRPTVRRQLIVYLTAHYLTIAYKRCGTSGKAMEMSKGRYASSKSTSYLFAYQRLVKAHTITPFTRVCR